MFRPWREVVRDPMWWLLVACIVMHYVMRATGHEVLQSVMLLLGVSTAVVDHLTRPKKSDDVGDAG